MSELTLVFIFVASIALVAVIAPIVRRYLRSRGSRLVTCPETNKPAAVELDSIQISFSSSGSKELRLKECSRWPERETCGQQCLRQIEAAPEDCLVRNILSRWYEGRKCALCGKAFGAVNWPEHKPGIMDAGGKTSLWSDLAAQRIPELLESCRPVCWDCHIAADFRNRRPDLLTDRPWKRQ